MPNAIECASVAIAIWVSLASHLGKFTSMKDLHSQSVTHDCKMLLGLPQQIRNKYTRQKLLQPQTKQYRAYIHHTTIQQFHKDFYENSQAIKPTVIITCNYLFHMKPIFFSKSRMSGLADSCNDTSKVFI